MPTERVKGRSESSTGWPRAATRGLVWIVVGLGGHAVAGLAGWPLVLRGTSLPLGLVVAGAGAVLLGLDLWRASRRTRRD